MFVIRYLMTDTDRMLVITYLMTDTDMDVR